MQYSYFKRGPGKGSLTPLATRCEQAIDVVSRELITPGDIKYIESKLHAKFVRKMGEMHYLFTRCARF
ncbi:hypothetical protein [Pseudoalteromonas sp. T1lg22]|uniref:hypothetical protein n=1 Tax=Pseudoalteromonas sp. T1lg22 TaxID=2077096 RepID=UPI000CF72DFA|nr:hypothetical protein [Pseudoalteromonas sp. T1lg22]